jgi:hypothetical protein
VHEASVADEIDQIEIGRPHVVLLGAGASRAALPNGDANGKRLPLMSDFADIVPVGDVLGTAGIAYAGRNFEELYSELCTEPRYADVRAGLERAIFEYFSSLSLPSKPTLYDHLILSLRSKDVIATFNWDPFLIQAIRRNRLVQGQIPSVLFLHGNVAAGYCPRDNVHGVRGATCSRCGKPFDTSSLLYPVAAKPYDDDPAIADAWRVAKASFKSAFMVTIFGYGAPQSDVSAIDLLLNAWGGAQARTMEQFEIIDVRSEDDLLKTWERFIHTHHYEVHSTAYDSWLFNHPRRSGEAYINQYLNALFIENNPIPQDISFDELWEWFTPLVDRERNAV